MLQSSKIEVSCPRGDAPETMFAEYHKSVPQLLHHDSTEVGADLMGCQIIRTSRLTLFPLSPAHVSSNYIESLNDKNHMQYSQHSLSSHSKATTSQFIREFERERNILLGVFRADDQESAIGSVGVRFSENRSSADLSLFMVREASGHGYGLEAWKSTIAHLVTEHGVRRVTAGTARKNLAMRRICEATGMVERTLDRAPFATLSGTQEVVSYYRHAAFTEA